MERKTNNEVFEVCYFFLFEKKNSPESFLVQDFDFDLAHPNSPLVSDLSDDEAAWKQLLDIVAQANALPRTPDYQEAIEQVTTQEIAAAAAIVNGVVEEIESRAATPDFQGSNTNDDDDIESVHEERATYQQLQLVDDVISTTPAVPSSPIVTPSKKTKREEHEEEDNICIDLRSSSDDDDDAEVESEKKQPEPVAPTTKRRKIVVAPADDDSDDDEEVVRVMFYGGGNYAKVDKSSIVTQMKSCLDENNVKSITTVQGVSNKIGTLFCIFDDTYVEAKKELVCDSTLVNLAMEGRVRMTPLSSLVSIVDECGIEQLNLDALRHCSFERRREIVKFKSHVDTANIVHSRWRITPGSVVVPPNTPILKSKQELLLYLRDQMFVSSK